MERNRNISITEHLYLVIADQEGWGVEECIMENEECGKREER